ncbi:MAG: GNAT family N-acetyltransferase [Bacteroidota bacterium]|nr:GNAT family N-acetyltransferase [Bacteroidota bacterium]MDP4231609.1 GNAT family N-acetyltransferase [Bacteroidota bacterium]MDP4236649.1 GNAT family N-acetyltransferase [Bacteroidota bacterium]
MIRKYEAKDRAHVIELVGSTGNFNSDEIAIATELIDICIEKPEQGDYFSFVFEDDESRRVAGFLIVGPTPATTGTYDMYWIASHPDFYGKGIAQQLDLFAEDFVRGRKGYLLIAETSSQPSYDRTRAFYAKQGYRVLSTITDYYKPGDDLIVFGKRV